MVPLGTQVHGREPAVRVRLARRPAVPAGLQRARGRQAQLGEGAADAAVEVDVAAPPEAAEGQRGRRSTGTPSRPSRTSRAAWRCRVGTEAGTVEAVLAAAPRVQNRIPRGRQLGWCRRCRRATQRELQADDVRARAAAPPARRRWPHPRCDSIAAASAGRRESQAAASARRRSNRQRSSNPARALTADCAVRPRPSPPSSAARSRGRSTTPVAIGSFAEFQQQSSAGCGSRPRWLRGRAVLRARRAQRDHRARRQWRRARRRCSLPAGGRRWCCAGVPRHARIPARLGGLRRHRARTTTDRFNLVLQRVRAPGIGADRGPGDLPPRSVRAGVGSLRRRRCWRESRLMRVAGRAAARAPGSHARCGARRAGRLRRLRRRRRRWRRRCRDYDLIGIAEARAGLFALRGRDAHFSLLCIPPLAARPRRRHRRPGGRGALLPPPPGDADRRSAGELGQRRARACAALRDWPLQSEDALMYFPRMSRQDRLRGRTEVLRARARCRRA